MNDLERIKKLCADCETDMDIIIYSMDNKDYETVDKIISECQEKNDKLLSILGRYTKELTNENISIAIKNLNMEKYSSTIHDYFNSIIELYNTHKKMKEKLNLMREKFDNIMFEMNLINNKKSKDYYDDKEYKEALGGYSDYSKLCTSLNEYNPNDQWAFDKKNLYAEKMNEVKKKYNN